MSGIALNAQHLCHYRQCLAVRIVNFQTNPTADFREAARQMDQSAFRANVLCRTLSYDMRAIGFVPFGPYFEGGQIARPGAMVHFDVAGHMVITLFLSLLRT